MNIVKIIMAVNHFKSTKWRHLVQVFDYALLSKKKAGGKNNK